MILIFKGNGQELGFKKFERLPGNGNIDKGLNLVSQRSLECFFRETVISAISEERL